MKRAIDLLLTVVFMILFWWLLLLVALLVRVKMGAPVMFRQERSGLHGAPFRLFKFRTMTDQRDESGQLLPDEARLLPVGRWIRKLSLDELPQLLNVWRGEISIVGPRPLLMAYLPLYSQEQAKRHLVKPGITGWAQVNGRNGISWEEKFKLDVWYVENHTILLDLKIIAMTFVTIIRSEGIHSQEHATMPMFKGESNS